MMIEPGIYTGSVRHTRVKPRRLSLRHRCFWLALDIDTIDEVVRTQPLLSHNRFNVLSLYDRDHGETCELGFREKVEALLSGAGFARPPARIILFSMPRVLGYGFNPLSLFFCLDGDGRTEAIIYEVHNTFKQRHCYIAPVGQRADRAVQSAEKVFFVSPFMDMDMTYTFEVAATRGRFLLAINARDAEGPVIFTSINSERQALTAASLFKAWVRHPLMSLKVIGAIHFHAARLWSKGIGLRDRPPPPDAPATLGQARSAR
ncbi:MAG: DUF1365 domain-containing protein [Hyphomicrobiaceae bacterium]